MTTVLNLTVICLVIVALPWTEGQFPFACVTINSLQQKECCPVPKGSSKPCGSDKNRGQCQSLNIREWKFTYSHFKKFQLDDDRHNWPNNLFARVCKCRGNFAGYDCGRCEYGYYGDNCNKKKMQIRRNFLKLSTDEKDRYMMYINMSKTYQSEYVVTTASYKDINETVSNGRDPASLFHNVSNYDLFTWIHYYAARDTIHPDKKTDADIDFAHDGQGFPTWHRLYLLEWERTLQELSKDYNFTIPYWDWTKNPEDFDPAIFSEDLLGVTQENGIVKGKYLDDWEILCTSDQTQNLVVMCDPSNRKKGLIRSTKKQKEDKAKNQAYPMTFPTIQEVNFALRFETFSLPPYSKESSCNFANMLEGYVDTKIGYRLPNAHRLHNQVHIVIGGTMGDVPSASNDPIFPLHHAFIDRIYEKWLRKYNKDASVLSVDDAPIGHNKDDVIVPLFPLYTHREMFKKSSEFGYDYDDLDEQGKSVDDEQTSSLSLGQCPVPSSICAESSVVRLCWWLTISASISGLVLTA